MSAGDYTIRRKVLTLFGSKFHIYNGDGNLIGFCKQKAFKLKEDIRIYTDESMTKERLVISARSIIDFSAAYDIVESDAQEILGTLRRKGLKSIFRDEWSVLDASENEIGTIKEDSVFMALLRRFFSNLIPQKFHLATPDGRQLAAFRTHFNPFIHRMTVTPLPESPIHPFLILSAGVLLMVIEGRQN